MGTRKAKATGRKRRPTASAEQRAAWDRAHAERTELINRPFIRTQEFGRSYLWAGTLIPREADLIKDNALGVQTQYNGRYAAADAPAEWDNIINSYEGGL